jgi:succinate dehydrogenase/fumarate reductase flavoprotein subunit
MAQRLAREGYGFFNFRKICSGHNWARPGRRFLAPLTDAHARALDADGRVIGGLYAAGDDMVSIMGGNYPGAGITLGPALTFGYIAGKHMAAM